MKYRSQFTFPVKDLSGNQKKSKEFEKAIKQLIRKERTNEIKEIIGKNKECKKILVVTKHSFGSDKKKAILKKEFHTIMKKNNFSSEVWFFDDIIEDFYILI